MHYIHRCILGLEEGVAVNSELTEEMWDLLDNYREWEATKKIALYPENYLNPTLRKSATAEYKVLQNTLMQGNLTDEEAANAYIKYFEDFAQLVNLQIVDTSFKDHRLYILGRTLAEPYIYYYRVGNFEGGKTGSNQTWRPWQKIEMQIPVKKAKIAHAFGRIFVFWLQKTEKEKQVENVSINDSTLTVNYIFKKADGNWSAQQGLSDDVKVNNTFEDDIRKHLSCIDMYKSRLEYYRNKKADKKDTVIHYFERGVWADEEEHIEYYQNEIKRLEGSISKTAAESKKNINSEKFDGKLKV